MFFKEESIYPINVLEMKNNEWDEGRKGNWGEAGRKVEEFMITQIFCLSHLKNRVLFCDMGKISKTTGILTNVSGSHFYLGTSED